MACQYDSFYPLVCSFLALYKGVIPKMLKLGPGMVCTYVKSKLYHMSL